MKKNIIIILILIIITALYLDLKNGKIFNQVKSETQKISTTTEPIKEIPQLTEDDYMDIALYVQDKNAAKNKDCKITTKIEYTIPKTSAVADVALKILFSDELLKYGSYKSVNIENGIANVTLASDMTSEGKPISSLSSCEIGHLMSVLKDTLVQYESVKSVKLFSSDGEVLF